MRFGIKIGDSALMYASMMGHLAVVAALLAKGADQEAKGMVGYPDTTASG